MFLKELAEIITRIEQIEEKISPLLPQIKHLYSHIAEEIEELFHHKDKSKKLINDNIDTIKKD